MNHLRKRLDAEWATNTARGDEIIAEAEAADRGLTAEESAELEQLATRRLEITRQRAALDAQRDAGTSAAPAGQRANPVVTMHNNEEDRPWGQATAAPFGEFLQAVYRAGAGHGMDPRLIKAAATGMGEAIGADGGFAVPPEFATGIEKEMWSTGEILSRVNERPIGGNSITFNVIDETSRASGSRRGSVLGYWVDEGTAPTASSVKLAPVEMKLRKLGALGYITDELMEDAPALQGELTEAFTEELQFMVEDAIIEGTGAGQPLGILNAACVVSVAKETGQAAATIVWENIQKMWSRMKASNRRNSVWLINQDCEPQLNSMTLVVGTGGVPVYLPPGGLSASPYASLMSRPVIPVEYCSTLGTVGDIILADLSRYRLIRKNSGIEQASSMHVRFTQGEQTFRAFYRVDGQPIPRAAITPFKGSNTVSPFVTLATRS